MRVLSKVIKPQIEYRGGLYYIRYSENQLQEFVSDSLPPFVPDTEEGEGEANYSYYQVICNDKNRDKIIALLVNSRYSYDFQIAIFANKDDGNPVHSEEWSDYQKFRSFSKHLTDEFLNSSA